MAIQTATGPAPQGIDLTPEDLALIVDGTGNIPDDDALRLGSLVLCQDPERFEAARCWMAAQIEEMRRMAADAGVELLADGLYVFGCLEQLRIEPWETPGDVLDRRLDVPYRELIAMARARADRAGDDERTEMRQLVERLGIALGTQIRGESSAHLLIDRLVEVGDEVAVEAFNQLVGLYRDRRAAAGVEVSDPTFAEMNGPMASSGEPSD